MKILYKISMIYISCLLVGCTIYTRPDQAAGMLGAPIEMGGSGNVAESIETGFYMPNGRGGDLLLPGAERTHRNASVEDAFELKLKARELAAQLLDTRNNASLLGLVAMPVSFVNLDDFNDTSSLGRYLGEAMFYEFNQRDFPVREYRLSGKIAMREGGEFALSRSLPPISTSQSWAAVLIGTYQQSGSAFFINARLVRPSDGMVLRTAQLVLPKSNLLASMTYKAPRPLFESGSTRVVSRRR